MISCVINTSALGPKANVVTGSRSPTPHAMRAYALRHFIIPSAIATFDEVIVVGEWEDGDGYVYIPVPSVHYNCIDALAQRQHGFEASTGDAVLFQHDDHWVTRLGYATANADVVVPKRFTIRGGRKIPLNNGEPTYISGHAAVYRREVVETCPWSAVPKVHTWDQAHTAQIVQAEFTVGFGVADYWAADVEYGATPWR